MPWPEVNPAPNPDVELLVQDGVELVPEDAIEIKRPFEPEKIKVRTIPIVVDQVVSRIAHEEIHHAPELQAYGRDIERPTSGA